MIKVKEAIVVEGRYDKSRLSSLVDGVIIETNGFGIFRDKQRMALLRRLAKERGLIVLTDSDGAGFLIRSRLSAGIPPQQLKHAYIPDVFGKERRKPRPSKEGKLGVEGIPLPVLQEALIRAGAQIEGEAPAPGEGEALTKADFYGLGLTGAPDSGARRQALQKKLGLPERLSANGLLQAVNALYGREEFIRLAQGLKAGEHKEDAEDGIEQTGAGRREV